MLDFKYFMPTRVCFGKGAVEKNKELLLGFGKKAIIVTGQRSSKVNGSLNDMEQALKSLGIEYFVFDQVEENPSLETVEKAAALGMKEKVEFVIGIGGGSPLDAAKAVGVFVKNPHITKESVYEHKELDSLPIVAVPTTSGTGSEVTPYSVLTVHKEETKLTLPQRVFPAVAFLDSSYTFKAPYKVTVNTAIDAFTHLVESYLNTNANLMSDLFVEKGLELFAECFKCLVNGELTEDFRDKVMLASMYAGIAISQTGTSLPHGMGYALTYHKGVPHGLANGILMVEYLRVFKNKEKLEKMLRLIGMTDLNELERVLDGLIQLDIEVSGEELVKYANDFTKNKEKLRNHPEKVGLEDIEAIYKRSKY